MPTAVAVWLPNVALSLVAIYLLARAAREDGSRRPALWDRLATALRQRLAWRGASAS